MELFWKDGDYVPDGCGGFRRAEGNDELLQRVLFLLTARRGRFPLMPELGSRLYLLSGQKAAEREELARAYVEEALGQEDLTVEEVKLVQESGRGYLTVKLRRDGEDMEATLGLEGW